MREGRGACFFIDTASAELLPFESKTIAITAYSDMWGEYKDELICEVSAKHSVLHTYKCIHVQADIFSATMCMYLGERSGFS